MKLGTKIQLYTTVMTVIVVILINLVVYYSYKNFSLNAEMGQLENRGANIMEELQKANANNVSSEAVLQAFLLSDGYVKVIDNEGNPVVRIATESEYASLDEPYSTSQYKKTISHEGMEFVMVSLPVIWDDGQVYNLQIYENVYFLYDTFEVLKWILAVSTLIILTVIFLLNRIITNAILKPVNKLIDKMKKTDDTSKYTMIEMNRKDTKELRELSEAFNEMMMDLKTHDENQQAFIMNASHELKTPITVISSYSQMIKRFGKTREDVLDEGINAISDETERMKYLTEQLLSFAKVNREDETFQVEPIRIVKLIRNVTARLETVYGRRIELAFDNGEMLGLVDVDTFDQLIKIFLDNACKYSSDTISVNIRELENNVGVTIADKGIGIPEEDIGHIFTRFYRVDKARARETGGSGLGLSIAQELADLNDISIDVTSRVNVGTTFNLSIKKVKKNEETE
ncbi:MAG TPA: HAMP domain-containing histidine kinase [Candidatus Salinicoccus stercoripullorum]|uniref:histidine kinase n=1 Tax=Candidatus Salinicoccus stercoripullorum TaxID=2838756 RepID=A0A9D1QJC1_9STAP|nr:HAMP domain-containing histidine kinase [Candidatus Salinicoccus stercoripullorum]